MTNTYMGIIWLVGSCYCPSQVCEHVKLACIPHALAYVEFALGANTALNPSLTKFRITRVKRSKTTLIDVVY